MEEINDVFWSIKGVRVYEDYFRTGIFEAEDFKRNYELIKNLSYNCQYLEFLNNSLNEEIHASLRVEFIKTFVIIGMSIIESYLYYLLKSLNLQKTTEYEEIGTFDSNQKQINNTIIKIESKVLKKLEKRKDSLMNLDFLLKKIEGKKLFGDDRNIYKQLNYLRKLRNKIHLYIVDEKLDHDYNNFKNNELDIMKNALRAILLSNKFLMKIDQKEQIFDFLFLGEC